MKRIAIVGLDIYPIPSIRGGAIEDMMTALIDKNEINPTFEFTVYTIKDKGLDGVKYQNTEIVQIGKNGIIYYLNLIYRCFRRLTNNRLPVRSVYMIKINECLIRSNFDLIFFATSNSQVSELSTKVKSKILYGVYSDYLNEQSYGIKKIGQTISGFVANEYLKQRIVEEINYDPSKIYVQKGALDITSKSDDERELIRSQVRKKYKIADDNIVVVYCGRLSKEKGPLELIKAIQRVPNCTLFIVGGSNFSKNDETEYVKRLHLEAAKCDDRVIFTGYVKDHKDVINYMYSADIGVVPSICNEAASGAMLEFRVAGIPTVISKMGGMPMFAGGNVIMVDYNEIYVEGLADAIFGLSHDRELRKKLSMNARKGIEEWSSDAYFESFIQIVSGIV